MKPLFRVFATLVALNICLFSVQAQNQKAKPQRKPNPAYAKIEDEPGLPRVLIIGDSISIGYTVDVRKNLKGKANVHRIPTNGGPTTRGLESIDQWLGDSKWDVIHFNWGLHDLKYMGADGKNLADPKASTSHQQVPIDEYTRNLETLVKRMKKTGAKLIWCSTTPVPKGAAGRVVGDSAKYNAAAAKVMKKQGVVINDLYAHANKKLSEIQREANVHFHAEGSAYLGKKVSDAILEQLH